MKTAALVAALATIVASATAADAYETFDLSTASELSPLLSEPSSIGASARTDSIPEPAALAPIAGAIIVALRRRRTAPER